MNKFIKPFNDNYTTGHVNKIRPKVILKEVESMYKNPIEMKLPVPSSEIGSLTTLEASMIICLLKILKPKTIFEYGTFLGYSTSILLKNSTKNAKIYSIDLGKEIDKYNVSEIDTKNILSNDTTNDDYLRIVQSKNGPTYIKNDINNNNSKLNLIFGDSTQLSIDNYGLKGNVNFVFVDGGHTYDIIKSDTKNAFEMIKSGIIIWHDYGSKIHRDVTIFLDELSSDKKIFHIENTMLAFHIIE